MELQKSNRLFKPSRVLFYVLALIVFYFALQYFNKLGNIEKLLFEMNPGWLFVAVGTQLLTYLLNALILRVLLSVSGSNISFFMLLKISIVIIFVNQALPSGGLSGNGYVFNQLTRRKVNGKQAFSTLVLESVCYYIAILMLLLIFYVWYFLENEQVNRVIKYTAIIGVVYYSFLALMMSVLSNWRTLKSILHRVRKFPKIHKYMEEVNLYGLTESKQGILKMFSENKNNALIAIGLQVLIIASDVLTVFAILKGFHFSLAFSDVVLGLLLSLIIGALPISPGSLIAYESGMTYFFATVGTPVHIALVVTLIFRFLTFWLPIPIGLLLYRRLQT